MQSHTMTNDYLRLEVLELGATVRSLLVTRPDGTSVDVVLAHAEPLSGSSPAYLGAVVGRYANRIAAGRFSLDGQPYVTPANEGTSTLHGGPGGFDGRPWRTVAVAEDEVTLGLVSPDGDQGFPGTLDVQVTYALDGQDVRLTYRATTDRPTVLNLTNHTYFNLDGAAGETVDDHRLSVAADHYLPVGPELVPTGEIAPVDGTPFDLRTPTRLGPRIRQPHPQLLAAGGLDHALVVSGTGLRPHATLTSPASGVTLEVLSDQPGIQVYSGNFLDGSIVGSGGSTYRQGAGIALETQHLPNSPNEPGFPSTTLRPGETFTSTTVWRFSTA